MPRYGPHDGPGSLGQGRLVTWPPRLFVEIQFSKRLHSIIESTLYMEMKINAGLFPSYTRKGAKYRPRFFDYVWNTSYSEEGEPVRKLVRKMRVPDWYLQSVVYLFKTKQDAENLESPGGSGFVVAPSERADLNDKTARYIVTNSHLLANKNYVVRFNAFSGGRPIIREYEVDDWHRHPDGDVAATFFELASGYGNYGVAPIITPTMVSPGMVENKDKFTQARFGIGDQVFMFGLLGEHYRGQDEEILPTARFGNVSMMPAQEILNSETTLKEESFLVEMYSMGGFSGSPVFVRRLPWTPEQEDSHFPPETRVYGRNFSEAMQSFEQSINDIIRDMWEKAQDEIRLLGINWGHLPENLKIKHKSSDGYDEELSAVGNSRIACVVPAWKIQELLDEPELVQHRNELMEEDRVEREDHNRQTGAVPDNLQQTPSR